LTPTSHALPAGYFTIPKVHWSTCKGLVPLISINVTGLIFNTYCLQYVDASFYQVARGLVLPFTVLFSYLLLSTRSSSALLFSVGVVCIGFFLGVTSQHINASPIGTMLGVFSSLTTSVHAIVVKKSLSVVKGSTMDLVYYNNLLSAMLLFPLVYLSGESTTVLEMVAVGGAPLKTFLTGATITGVFGFLICIAGFLSIKVTSPVTHMISSAVRGVIQTFLGKWIFGDIITA
jgi:GDP-fucose transporter C1